MMGSTHSIIILTHHHHHARHKTTAAIGDVIKHLSPILETYDSQQDGGRRTGKPDDHKDESQTEDTSKAQP